MTTSTKNASSATLTGASPEARYAAHHRHIEAGSADEQTWTDMVKVCLELDKGEEAVEAYRHLTSFGIRAHAHALLVDKGLLRLNEDPPDPRAACVTDADLQPTFSEEVAEGFQYLVAGRMPLLAIVGTLVFGGLFLAGGILTSLAGTIAANLVVLPLELAAYALTWAVARRVLVTSCQGYDDPPDIPPNTTVVDEAKRALVDVVIPAAVLLTPVILLRFLTTSASLQVPLLIFSLGLLPLIFSLRQMLPSWREVRPLAVARALTHARPLLPQICAVNALLFAPAALTMHLTLHQPLFLVVAYTGLLSVMPTLIAVRLLGQTFHYHADAMQGVAEVPSVKKAQPVGNQDD